MINFRTKIVEAFRYLTSDAVPREPRPPVQETLNDVTGEPQDHNNENEGTTRDTEEINIESVNRQEDNKPKNKFNFRKNNKKDKPHKTTQPNKNESNGFNVHTQAEGPVINIVNSPGFRWGNDFVYYLGPTQPKADTKDNIDPEENIEKTNEIIKLLEAKILLEHDYIDYVAKNLGKNWHRFFRKLGYNKGRIETFEYDNSRNVGEARYQLLLDWMHNSDDATLGRLATLLWEEGERQIVKELSIMYSTNNKK